MKQSHRSLYSRTTALPAPACIWPAEAVGILWNLELRRKVALWNCPCCNSLIACANGVVIWELVPPPAAVPVERKGGETS